MLFPQLWNCVGICITKAMNRPLGGALRAAARPWLIPAGKYIPADRPQRSTPPRRGTPPQLVREVAALYGGVAVLFGWSVSHGGSSGGLCGLYRGQIYGSSSCDFSQSQFFVTYIHTGRKIKPTHLQWWQCPQTNTAPSCFFFMWFLTVSIFRDLHSHRSQ